MKSSLDRRAVEELRLRAAGQNNNPATFLQHFWQKRPLLVRQAFVPWQDRVSRDELAGLACEQEVESRLVMERGGATPWQVILGPQKVARLQRLPESHWTLLVQNVDRFIPGVAALLQPFRFIPDWRVDDVMISFAPRGGSVGPHLDSYDVFLLQGQGRRRWRLDSHAPTNLRPGLDLRILRSFQAKEDWILNAGDMLYLPPNVAHYGVALDECLTYSIGFRSPSAMDLLAAAQERLMQPDRTGGRFLDPGLRAARHPGEISRAAVHALRRLMEGALSGLGSEPFDDLVGEILTEPKEPVVKPTQRMSGRSLGSRLQAGGAIVRSPGTRIAFLRQGRRSVLFVDGQRFLLESRLAFAGPLLSARQRFTAADLSPHLAKADFLRLLAQLLNVGAFRLET